MIPDLPEFHTFVKEVVDELKDGDKVYVHFQDPRESRLQEMLE